MNYFGYTPEKMRIAREFCADGINKKSLEELIDCFNKLFNKNATSTGCNNCARNRYKTIIVNFLKNGEAIWKEHNLIDLETAEVATEKDIKELFKPVEEPKKKRRQNKNTKTNEESK